MSEEAASSLEAFKAKGSQIFDPAFFGPYSFEYAYRLLLVYLSTNKTMIKAIRMTDPAAFDHAFEDDLKKAIQYVADYRGVVVDENLLTSLLGTANESLVLYIKSQNFATPGKVAKSVAKSMDKESADFLGQGKKVVVQNLFAEA